MQASKKVVDLDSKKQRDYAAIVHSPQFQKLLKEKKKFILPMTIFFFIFYFSLPVMTSYFTILNNPFYGKITWAWVFAFAQFIMTWGLCMLYSKRAGKFDDLTDEIRQKEGHA